MPCFKGLAVSIHTPDGPIPEYSIQKQQRLGRITSYIPVPPPKPDPESSDPTPQQSTFAVSITLLTPGLRVPYSAPKPTPENPYPEGRIVGGLPLGLASRGLYDTTIPPYMPKTSSPNETVAAYIYFDGRAKEEVATLLRKGEETWVNSRWVSVPDAEGGGLAEREFLFREVGLERWLNGLDLTGSDKAKKIERRHKKLEKKRRAKAEARRSSDESEEHKPKLSRNNGVLRYGDNANAPVEAVMADDGDYSLSSSDSDDEPPEPEAAGQIKIALFRVLASGEIKRGEYSPQFDAHDDDDDREDGQGAGEDIDHTTSFAKPKTLDPKSISTQTVTGIDPPDAPFAVFTFFYRGEKQLQKMGIVKGAPDANPTPQRKSVKTDFSKLGELKANAFGAKGFSSYRDAASTPRKPSASKSDPDAMDSDADDEDEGAAAKLRNDADDDKDAKAADGSILSAEEAAKQRELADGVRKIKLKRQHSATSLPEQTPSKSPYITGAKSVDSPANTNASTPNSLTAQAGTPADRASPKLPTDSLDAYIGSPLKRQRAAAADSEDPSILQSLSSASHPSSVPTSEPGINGMKQFAGNSTFSPSLGSAPFTGLSPTSTPAGDPTPDSDEEL